LVIDWPVDVKHGSLSGDMILHQSPAG